MRDHRRYGWGNDGGDIHQRGDELHSSHSAPDRGDRIRLHDFRSKPRHGRIVHEHIEHDGKRNIPDDHHYQWPYNVVGVHGVLIIEFKCKT
jgi:hypothetical protein